MCIIFTVGSLEGLSALDAFMMLRRGVAFPGEGKGGVEAEEESLAGHKRPRGCGLSGGEGSDSKKHGESSFLV